MSNILPIILFIFIAIFFISLVYWNSFNSDDQFPEHYLLHSQSAYISWDDLKDLLIKMFQSDGNTIHISTKSYLLEWWDYDKCIIKIHESTQSVRYYMKLKFIEYIKYCIFITPYLKNYNNNAKYPPNKELNMVIQIIKNKM